MNREQINSTMQGWMSKQHTKQVINGQLVVEDGKVSLQQEDGSLTELSPTDRIEVMNGKRFEPAPYSRILEKVDSAGWPIYAGLYASVERFRSEPQPSLKQIAHRLFSLVDKWRTTEELIEIGTYFRTYAANIAGGWKEKEEYQAAPERELQSMNAFFAARHLYYLVAEGMTTDELLEIGRLIKVIAKEKERDSTSNELQ